jgi:hypothetical protein
MLKITVDWYELRAIAKEKAENYNELRTYQKTLPALEDVLADRGFSNFEAFVNDVSQLPDWVIDRAKFSAVKPLQIGVRPSKGELGVALRAYQVHLPGNELLEIDEVQVVENVCTESLQGELDQGWRIVAVLPLVGQRRPDYVLGRYSRAPKKKRPETEQPF